MSSLFGSFSREEQSLALYGRIVSYVVQVALIERPTVALFRNGISVSMDVYATSSGV